MLFCKMKLARFMNKNKQKCYINIGSQMFYRKVNFQLKIYLSKGYNKNTKRLYFTGKALATLYNKIFLLVQTAFNFNLSEYKKRIELRDNFRGKWRPVIHHSARF